MPLYSQRQLIASGIKGFPEVGGYKSDDNGHISIKDRFRNHLIAIGNRFGSSVQHTPKGHGQTP